MRRFVSLILYSWAWDGNKQEQYLIYSWNKANIHLPYTMVCIIIGVTERFSLAVSVNWLLNQLN